MKRLRQAQSAIQRRLLGYGAALVAVALVSGLIAAIEQRDHSANVSILYLAAVLATASLFGSGAAVLASVAAFLAFDWFFVPPYHALTVDNPEEWVTLLLFLLTAMITGQLAAGQRRRARDARQREREAVVLYEVARLLGEPDLNDALRAVAERLFRQMQLEGVIVEISDGPVVAQMAVGEPGIVEIAEHRTTTPRHVLGHGTTPSATVGGAPGRWIRVVPPRPPNAGRDPFGDRLHVVPVRRQDRQVGTFLLVRKALAPEFTPEEDRLLSAVATLVGSTVERVRLQREATEAEVLRRADQLKSALLNAVSHDLRTPLASIIASAGSLQQTDVSWTDQERREFAEEIEHEARRLNWIVGNLLDLSRIEAGSLRPQIGWYDFGALVDDVLGRLRPITAQHKVVVAVTDDLPPVPLDYVEIDQVLSNLIENAVKYTPADTEIRISARRVGAELSVEVADLGPGIPAHVLPRLFESFYRGTERGPRPIGTGLGLSVAKGLVEAHGGHIEAESQPGHGARFRFSLPMSSPTEVADPAVLVGQEKG